MCRSLLMRFFEALAIVCRKWIGAGQTELDNLIDTPAPLSLDLSPEQRDEIKKMARSTGQKYIELPAKAVFTIKPCKFKIRIFACGNKTDESFWSHFHN